MHGASAAVEQYGEGFWRQAAEQLAAVPHEPTALTGPYWYGQGWDDVVHHLHDMADGVQP